jgi:integrase
MDPRTGTLKEANRAFEGITLREALTKQVELRDEIQSGNLGADQKRVKFADFAESLYRRKIQIGELTSAKSVERWHVTLDLHLGPAFGEFYIDAIRRADIEEWKAEQGKKVKKRKYSPNTVNGWLSILLTILRQAVVELELERDPTIGVKPLDNSQWHTYTEEQPNALTVEEVPLFLAKARVLYPQHFGMIALGLATGRRPSELRPLRRNGETPDLLWDEGVLLIRRSETMGEVVERTKTKRRLRIPLPSVLMDILKWHQDRLPVGPMRDSDLLFPSETGGYRSASCLDRPLREVTDEAKIKKHLTPRFMRRTFQDLGRAAQVHDFVVRSISGHATAIMQEHYSTVNGEEVRAGLAKVISIAGFLDAHRASGDQSGDRAAAA